jgi:hypothetical protein
VVFFVLLAVPLVVALGGFIFHNGVTWKEFLAQLGVQAVVAGIAAAIVHYSNVRDTEVWNGSVVSKAGEHVSCEHSYQCNCITTSCGKDCTTTICQTCYDHSYDVDWDVRTSNDEVIKIARVDRQGVYEPPRFSAVAIGEPTAVEHDYANYIKAAPGTLFRHQGLTEKYASVIPKYPEVYDYYRDDRLVLVGGAAVPAGEGWNDALDRLNAEVGRPKQANIILVLVKGQPQDYFYALEEAWIGGKKNDIVLVVGVDDQLKPQWATVMCWTTQEMFKVQLRDAIMGEPTLTKDRVMADIKTNVVSSYVRKPMADFQYLEASITPSPFQWGLALVLSLLIAGGLTYYFAMNDPFGDERRKRYGTNDPWWNLTLKQRIRKLRKG